MINKIFFLPLFFSLLLCACGRQKKHQSSFDFIPPEVVEAKGYVVSQDKMAPPEITPAKEIKSKAVSKPKLTNINSNISPVGKPRIVAAGAPKICTPGQAGFALPTIVPAIDSPFKAGIPKVTIAGVPQTRENNPASFSILKVEQGLKSNWIFPIIQDKAGNLWIACYEGGVSKYDGRSFTNYTAAQGLCSDNIWSILEDSKGNIWFGGFDGGGLTKFDGKSFTSYKNTQGLSDSCVISILEDKKGNLWFGTRNGGANEYDGKTFTHYTTKQGLSGNEVRSIVEDSLGNLWFGTHSGLSRYDRKSFSNYTTDQGLSNADIMCILEDRKGNFWISTFGGGVNKYDGRVFEHYAIEQGLPGSAHGVNKILEDKSGDLWFTLYGEGVFKYNGESFTHFSFEQGLSNNRVHSIREDKNGNLWLGTDDGLCRYHGKTFTHLNSSLGFSEGSYNCIEEDETGNLWAGMNGGGLNRFDGKSVARYTIDQGLSSNQVMCLLNDSKGNLWVGTKGGGINKYDGNSFSQFETVQAAVWCILEDKKGNIWFGTFKGLYKYDGKNFTHFGTAQGLSWESINSICEDRNGNLWLGTEYDGVVNKLDLSAAETGRYSFTHYNINHGTSVSRVYSILADKNNNLWFGINAEGVIKFDRKFFTRYTTDQGLSSNSVSSIVEDKEGNLWILTNNGLCKMKSPANNTREKPNPDHTQISLFTTWLYEDGFLGVGSHLNSMILGRDGNIWAGAGNRLTCYHPEGDIPDTIPPTIQLSGVALFDENINWLDVKKKKDSTLILSNGSRVKNFNFSGLTSWYNQPENLQLAHNNNYITFQFIGITTNRPKQVRYKYFLEGLDANWSSITNKPEATYSNLPNGTYTFKAKAVNSEGFWSKELAYTFTILPPWWKTWWFRIIAGLLIVVAFYGIIRWRLHQKFKLQVERSEKVTQLAEMRQKTAELEMQALRAQMNPHFIFNSLNSINRFILQNNKAQASEYLTKFSKLVRMILQNSQASLITLESELEALELYLDLEALRFEHHFDYKIAVPKDLDIEVLKVPPLIIQPFVENAIWHGLMHKEEKGQLDIDISQEDDHLIFKVTDDGIGRKQAAILESKSATRHKSMGLKITADRITMLHKLNGNESPVTINDLVHADGSPAGTEVIIKMPVTYA
ncbi:two-component regulator propeller domain-containing protein [Terrimonas pollutisoli]|uniref:two-component regulator propeller domain-containing protein n=1 Tax=Terrimonas pollutisoli TaxID=3034147 RepID=UPI0023EAA694|nr:two-component regulator propeller domain-containing protein [Terrimonas sp. H1YJ31]